MPNWCSVSYKCVGKLDPHKVIKDLEKPGDNCHSEVKEYEKNRT